jgi:hypothetical protein
MPTGISMPAAGAAAKLAAIKAITPTAAIFNTVKAFALAHPLAVAGLIGSSVALLGIYDALRNALVSPAQGEPQPNSENPSAAQRPVVNPEPFKSIW